MAFRVGQIVKNTRDRSDYARIGEVVEVSESRVRVLWTRYVNGNEMRDPKRTWMSPKALVLVVAAGNDPFPEDDEV